MNLYIYTMGYEDIISKYECDIVIEALEEMKEAPQEEKSYMFTRYICALSSRGRDDFSPLIERLGPLGPFNHLSPELSDVKDQYILSLCGGDRVFMTFMMM